MKCSQVEGGGEMEAWGGEMEAGEGRSMWTHDLDLEAQTFRKAVWEWGGGVELNTYGGGWRQGGGKIATGWGKVGDRARKGGNRGVCGRSGGGGCKIRRAKDTSLKYLI